MTKTSGVHVHAVGWLVLVAVAALLGGCRTGPTDPVGPPEADDYLAGPYGESIELEYVFPGEEEPTLITAELYEGNVLIEGDILLGTLEELTPARANIRQQSHSVAAGYWPATAAGAPYVYEVPYVISDDFPADFIEDFIEPAIDFWNENTPIELVERDGEIHYVEFMVLENRCWSEAGRQEGRQVIGLDPLSCRSIGTVVHEIGHTVGLKHEQQRSDRDDFVEIIWENIKTDPDMSGNFALLPTGLPLGPYGYDSIMHYSSTAFGKVVNGAKLTTIQSLVDPIDPSNRLTDGDIDAIRRLYPEFDLPYVRVTAPEAVTSVNEGEGVTFEGYAVVAPTEDPSGLMLRWWYDRNGVPVLFATTDMNEPVTHTFCDGQHVVTAEAVYPNQQVVTSATVQVKVADLGLTNPPPECPILVMIDEPLPGAVYSEGVNINLSATIADDHPETHEPLYPVTWRRDSLDGSILGQGLQAVTKLGAGQRTIFVTYGSATASVTITVQETGTPPVATVASPSDESTHNWSTLDGVNTYLDVGVSGSGADAEDGALTGSNLVWETRRQGQGAYVRRGEGTSPTLRLPMESGTVRYDVRVTATDSDDMADTETIQIVIVWPPS